MRLAGATGSRAGRAAVLAAALLSAGCAPDDDATESTTVADSVATPADTTPPAPAARPVTFTARPQRTTFAHNPHRDVRCSVCHENVPGHAVHSAVPCVQCHEMVQAASGARPGSEQCLGCHHQPGRRDCGQCHPAAPQPLRRQVSFALPRGTISRELTFDHERHKAFECRSCHVAPVTYAVTGGCAACHERHHNAQRDCAACHPARPLDIHTVRAHLGCGGAGCHENAAVLALPQNRAVCLSCHRDKVIHEPGRECAPCHFPGRRGGP
jgi:hypothetical protein